jgi:hypothetical protein
LAARLGCAVWLLGLAARLGFKFCLFLVSIGTEEERKKIWLLRAFRADNVL